MIAFDIDGVVADLQTVLRKAVLDKYDFDITNVDIDQYLISVPGVSSQELSDLVLEIILLKSDEIKPYPKVAHTLQALYKVEQKPIVFVTARRKETMYVTHEWIKNNIMVPAIIHSVRSSEKCNFLKERGITYFTDDLYETAAEVAQCIPWSFLMSRPWNENKPDPSSVIRVRDLREPIFLYLGGNQ
jgi:uncharacterized HAD superfamily protein